MKSKALITVAVAASFLLTSCAANDTAAVQPLASSSSDPSANPLNDKYSQESMDNRQNSDGHNSVAVPNVPEKRDQERLRTGALFSLDMMFRYVRAADQKRPSNASDKTFKSDYEMPYKMMASSVSESDGKKIIEDFRKLSKSQPYDVKYTVDMDNVKVSDFGDGPTATILVKDIKAEDEHGKVSPLGATDGKIMLKSVNQGWVVTSTSGV